MASYKNFQVDRNKYSSTGILDIYKRKRKVNKLVDKLSKNEKLINGFKIWTSFYRANPHRFIEEYFGVKLHLFQKIIIFMIEHVSMFMYLAARGQGKSFVIALYSVARCVLYPGTKIKIASGTKNQAKLIITEKIQKELMEYPNIAREIRDIKTGNDNVVVVFQNGSTIEAVVSTDSARGYRCNILILDEFRLIKEENVTKVLRPFLSVNRQPPYLMNPKYSHLVEENKEIYISSAYYKSNWIWSKAKSFRKSMLSGKDYFLVALDYKLSMHHGLLSKERIEKIKTEEDFDPIAWMMEYECLFFGENEKAYFKLDELNKCRTLIKPFYPIDNVKFISMKDKKRKSTKQDGEVRIIGVDVALMGGNDNDNTIFTLMRLLPDGEHYIKHVPYIESMNGVHSEKQAIRLKQLFYDFEADYVVMDTVGNGMSIFDDCSRVLYDEERDVEYPAWTSMNNDEMSGRALDKNALPIVYSLKVVKQEMNHQIAVYLKQSFEKGRIKLLVNDIEGREYLIDKHNLLSLSPEEQVKLLKPYVQTTMLINEMVNLESETKGGYLNLKEVGRNRKDRYSSLAYANYFAKILEANLRKNDSYDDYNFYIYN